MTNLPPRKILVRDVMVPRPTTVSVGEPLSGVVRVMNDRRIGAVLVINGSRLAGIFTERDLLRAVAAHGGADFASPVDRFMSTNPYTIEPNATWEEAVAAMERLHVRHLPVIDRDKLEGICSSRQLMAHRTTHLNGVVAERTALLDERNRQIERNLAVAGRLMNRLLLPGAPTDWPELAWGIHYQPLDPLGGDYYDFSKPSPDQLGVLIADASGHSLPAALVAIMTRIAFAESSRRSSSPGEVLASLNQSLQGLDDERFVTAFYGIFDRTTRKLTYANAGHPTPLHFSAKTGRCSPLKGRGFMLGIVPQASYAEDSLTLEPDDRLCLFTDGSVDSCSFDGGPFGTDRLAAAIAARSNMPAEFMVREIVELIRDYRGSQPKSDDCTMLIAQAL